MNRYILSAIIPPIAVCRYGCAGCCAAPIGVFWLAGIVSLVYGYNGGPLSLEGISLGTMGLGFLLWAIASVWAMITVHNVNDDLCKKKSSPLCGKVHSRLDDTDPMDEIRKAR